MLIKSQEIYLKTLPEINDKVNYLLNNPKTYHSIINGKEYIGNDLYQIKSPLFKNKVIGSYSLVNNFDIDYKKA